MLGNEFNIKQLVALVWVADLGSFRKAAAHLNTTQPNISARIAALESTLGVVLMHRGAGPVQMTEKGEQVLQAARSVLRQAEELLEVAQRPDLIEDRLRLGVTELIAFTWLHKYLRRLKEEYPSVSVELTVDLSRHLDGLVESNQLDLVIQSAPFGSEASGVIELGRHPYVWVAEQQIARVLEGRVGVEDLIPHGILTHSQNTQIYAELEEYASRRGLSTSRFVPSNSLSPCLQMAKDGLGVALLPEVMVAREVEADTLKVLDVDWTPTPLRFAARYQADKAPRFIAHAAEISAVIALED